MSELDLTHTTRFWGERRERRVGVLLHYDQSSSDEGSLSWLLRHPNAKVSYQRITMRDGTRVQIAPDQVAAWHAGVCRSSDPELLDYSHANSAWYGVAIAAHDEGLSPTAEREHATEAQFKAVVQDCVDYFLMEGWEASAAFTRIKGHHEEAWPRGRRRDPVGFDEQDPVLDVDAVCLEVFRRLFDILHTPQDPHVVTLGRELPKVRTTRLADPEPAEPTPP